MMSERFFSEITENSSKSFLSKFFAKTLSIQKFLILMYVPLYITLHYLCNLMYLMYVSLIGFMPCDADGTLLLLQ